ncbi:MAG: hypothetical protein R6V72_14630 [Cyclobacterium sp.]
MLKVIKNLYKTAEKMKLGIELGFVSGKKNAPVSRGMGLMT